MNSEREFNMTPKEKLIEAVRDNILKASAARANTPYSDETAELSSEINAYYGCLKLIKDLLP